MRLTRENLCVAKANGTIEFVSEDDGLEREVIEASGMVQQLVGQADVGVLLKEVVSWTPYVTLLYRNRRDPWSVVAATTLFLQSKGVTVQKDSVMSYFKQAYSSLVVPQAESLVEMFTAGVSLLANAVMGIQTAELVQKTALWGAAMKIAHWLILGPLHLLLGGVGGVKLAMEYYESVFPNGMGAVSVITSLTVLFKAVWDYGLPILTGKMTVAEAMANNQAYAWIVECQEAINNSSDYEWLKSRGYISETTQALTVEFEQYIASLRTNGKLHAAAYVSTNPPLFGQVVAMEKQMSMLAMRVRALRTGIENKVQPVCIVLLSVPGCQKSTFQALVLRMVWSCLYPGVPFDNSMVASVNPAAARLDNVNGQTRILVIDDAAQYNLEYVKNPVVANPMNFVNTVPTMLDQAEISRKGTEMMNHQAVLINSNSRTMQILRINTCPAAAFRRIWRTLVIAPKNGERVGAHASRRVLTLDELNNLYNFSVEEYVCEGNTVKVRNVFSKREVCTVQKDAKAEEITIAPAECRSFAQCVQYLKVELEEYLRVQKEVVGQKEHILTHDVCTRCGNITPLCVCSPEPVLRDLKDLVAEVKEDEPLSDISEEEVVHFVTEEDDDEYLADVDSVRAQMHITPNLDMVFTGLAAGVAAGTLWWTVKKAKPRVQRIVENLDATLINSAMASYSMASMMLEAKTIVAEFRANIASLKQRLRTAAVETLSYSIKVGCAVLIIGFVFTSIRKWFVRAVSPQGMSAFESLGLVPPLNTHTWPKGVYTPYVMNPADPNALRAKVPMNKVLSVLDKAKQNLVRLSLFMSDTQANTVYGLALGPGRILTVFHLFSGITGVRTLMISDRPKGGLSCSRSVMVDVAKDVVRIPNKDYCIVAVGTSMYFPITCFVPQIKEGGKDLEVRAELYRYDPDTLEDVTGESHLEAEYRANAFDIRSLGYRYIALAPYGSGTCGTLVVTSALGAPYIVGLHSLGQDKGSYGWCELLLQSEVDAAMAAMDGGISSQCGLRYSEKFNGRERPEVGDPHSRTIFVHVAGFGAYVANFRTLRTTDQGSAFERTPLFHKVVAATGMKLDVPNLKARIEDGGTYVDPLLRAAALNSSPPGAIDPELMDLCFADYFDDLESVPGFTWDSVGFLSIDQALNGEPAAVNSMNFASAAGPWVGRKKRDHVLGEPGSYKLDEVMEQEVDGVLDCWENGESAGLTFNSKSKDEPRNVEKVPRTFYAGPFSETLLTRMLFGGFFDYVKKFIGKTEHAVGINCCDSVAWGEVITSLGGLDAEVFALDACDFDLTNQLAPEVQWQIHLRMAAKKGWKDIVPGKRDPRYWQRCLAREAKFYYRSYRGEIVLQRASQPSGRSYTSEINSICTSVYERMYYYSAARLRDGLSNWVSVFKRYKFSKDIVLINYGDDFVLRRLSTGEWYAFDARETIASQLGMKYSMPDKQSALSTLPLRKVDFLKRGFNRINDLWVAPLEMASILKSFAFYRRSGSLTRRQAIAEAALNAHAQLYMHGEEEYYRGSLMIRDWLETLRTHPDYGNVVEDVYPVEPKGLGYDKLLELHRGGEYNEITTGVAPTPQSRLETVSTFSVKTITEMNNSSSRDGGMPNYAATGGSDLANGIGDDGAPRSVANAVEQPATVAIPQPLLVRREGHGTEAGTSLASHQDSLAEFLSRPVGIATVGTTSGAHTNTKPWAAFLQNSLVAQKINAFGYIRGTLHIRFVMSASQFVQGRVYVAYNPGGTLDDQTFNRSTSLTSISHLPFAGYIDPGIGNDIEWEIPYHEARPYTPVYEVDEMGGRLYTHVSVPFENVNTGTPSGTLIQVLAWMTDVELRVAATPQSGVSNNSGMSRALLAASGGLKAAAALVGAKTVSNAIHAVGDMASAFGFTREIDTRDHVPTRLRTNAGWAATEGAECAYPLTADPLAEKTVATDFSVGVQEDELVVAKMAGRYSYVSSVNWTSASSTIIQFYVSPFGVGSSCVGYTALPFGYWRGSMKFKFSAVRTSFHKGKIVIKWSPGTMAVNISLNTGYSVIWDLDATPEIEVLIPYNRESYWSKSGGPGVVPEESNGYLSLYVMEPLTGPTITENVPIHIFAAGGPDFSVTCPTLANMNNFGFGQEADGVYAAGSGVTPFPPKTSDGTPDPIYPQASEEDFSSAPNMYVLGPPSSSKDAALRSMGEQIVSFRELLKRKQLALRLTLTNSSLKFVSTYPKSALAIVSYPSGVGHYTASPYEQNLMTFLMPMFLGISGTTKWDLVVPGSTVAHIKVVRGFGHPQMNYGATDNLDEASYQGMAYSRSDLDGVMSVVSPQYIRDQFTYVAPYYQDKYLEGSAPNSNLAMETRDNGFFATVPGASATTSALVSAGDDFNLIYFLGPPPATAIA